MKKVTIMNSTAQTARMVMRLFIKTLNALFVVLIEIMKLMGQAMIDVTEWFYHTVIKVVRTTYSS